MRDDKVYAKKGNDSTTLGQPKKKYNNYLGTEWVLKNDNYNYQI